MEPCFVTQLFQSVRGSPPVNTGRDSGQLTREIDCLRLRANFGWFDDKLDYKAAPQKPAE